MKSWYLFYLSFTQQLIAAMALHPRQDDQDVQTQAVVKCPDGLPFSCQADRQCIPTNAQNTTVICCPQGSDCSIIQQINCDRTQQDQTQYPENQVHSSDLQAQLPQCGSQCCPSGYNCAGNLCVMQAKPGTTSSKPSVPPPIATTAPSTTAEPTATGSVSPISGTLPSSESHSNSKIIAIVVPLAILAAALIVLAILWFLKRRRQQKRDNYIIQKPLHRTSTGSPDFMGRTPRAFSHQEQYTAPMSGAVAHSRSQSEPEAPTTAKSDGTVVSAPMWNPQLNGGAPMSRTDFLLRRGSVETGYEGKIKPSWSTRSKHRPKSLRPLILANRSVTEPNKVPKTPSGKSTRLTSLFSTPLRFGLPSSPSPGKNGAQVPQSRPPRREDNLAKLVKLEGKTVPTGEGKRVSNAMPSPKKAKKMRLRDRSESARRPLMTTADGASPCVNDLGDGQARGQSLERQDSDASATTIESDSSGRSGSQSRGRRTTNASSETINVLLPPPSVFQTPPPPNVRSPPGSDQKAKGESEIEREMVEVRRETTFEEMMRQAGWKGSEWNKQ